MDKLFGVGSLVPERREVPSVRKHEAVRPGGREVCPTVQAVCPGCVGVEDGGFVRVVVEERMHDSDRLDKRGLLFVIRSRHGVAHKVIQGAGAMKEQCDFDALLGVGENLGCIDLFS